MTKEKSIKDGKGKNGKKVAVRNLKEKRAAKAARRAEKSGSGIIKIQP